jgi:hypothetical protein
MREVPLPGGNTTGAVLVGDVVHKRASPWTPTVHAVLRHLEDAGFDGAPRALGFDDLGREMITYLPGETIGDRLVGFYDWDIAGPSTREWDLAFSALPWVPLASPSDDMEPGSRDVEARSRRFHLFLDAYGYDGDRRVFRTVMPERARVQAGVIRRTADAGDPASRALLPIAGLLERSASHVEALPDDFWPAR